ncbi:MAG: phasin family protein [Methylocella sp.]
MAEQDQRATGTGTEGAAGSFDSAVNALSMNTLNATTKNMRAIAGEILEISKQSFELTTKTLEKLRTAHGVDEVAAIQVDFMKQAFEHAAQHGRKFGELVAAFPTEITKTYQEGWLKSVSAATKATEKPN